MEKLILFLAIVSLFFIGLASFRLNHAFRLQSDNDFISIAWKLLTRSMAISLPLFAIAISYPEMPYGGPLALLLGICASIGCAMYNVAYSRRLDAYSRRTGMFGLDVCADKVRNGTSGMVFGSFLFCLMLINLPSLFTEVPQVERLTVHLLFSLTFIIGMTIIQIFIPRSWKKREEVKEEDRQLAKTA